MTEGSLRENILAAQVVAAMQGHDLGPFEPVEEEPGTPKYQAFCHSCGKSVYVSNVTVYSILKDNCPGNLNESLIRAFCLKCIHTHIKVMRKEK